MGVQNVMSLSLGEWLVIAGHWAKAHADKPPAPSEEEFEEAVLASRGIGGR